MKPRTGLQKRVLKCSHSLRPLSDYQMKEAIDRLASHIAKHDSNNRYTCLDCTHEWKGDASETVVCPHCGRKLTVDKSRKRTFKDLLYFAVVTVRDGLQVVRMFHMTAVMKKGKTAEYNVSEAFQYWLTKEGGELVVGRRRMWMSHYIDAWDWSSDLELRRPSLCHTVHPRGVVGKPKVIPIIKRNGFSGDFYDCDPKDALCLLLTDNRFETLWKNDMKDFVRLYKIRNYLIDKYWSSVKIVMRHGYRVKDVSLWLDMLEAIDYCGKDVRNPKLICPENLAVAHDLWISRKSNKQEKERRELRRERELAAERRLLKDIEEMGKRNEQYLKAKSKFLDLEFKDNELRVTPLQSVDEFMSEGQKMSHCVFANGYYKKDSSLIFHAMIDGMSVATIEFDLQSLKVVQCRGAHNSAPALKDRIITLVDANVGKIAQRLTA